MGAGGHATPVPLQIGQKTHLAIHSPRALTIVDAADGKQVWTTSDANPLGSTHPTRWWMARRCSSPLDVHSVARCST